MQRQRLCRLRAFLAAVMKIEMRKAALEARVGLVRADAAILLLDAVLGLCPPPAGAVVGGFAPMGDEIDVMPLLEALHRRGHRLALPVTTPRGNPLIFRAWQPGAPLEPGRFGTSHPADPTVLTPDFFLVPLLAFDARGNRLGYGGGYYDRSLAAQPGAFRLGVAYAGQQVEKVPACATDIALHAIATEAGIVRAG